jgi:hypothetical protein
MSQLFLTNLRSKTRKLSPSLDQDTEEGTPKTTTQGVSGPDKDIKEEVEKIRDTSPQTHYSFYLFTVSSSKKGRAVYYIHLHKRTYPYE